MSRLCLASLPVKVCMQCICALQVVLASTRLFEAYCQFPRVKRAVGAALQIWPSKCTGQLRSQKSWQWASSICSRQSLGMESAISPDAGRILCVQDDSVRPDIAVHHRLAMQCCQRALRPSSNGKVWVCTISSSNRTQVKQGRNCSSRLAIDNTLNVTHEVYNVTQACL